MSLFTPCTRTRPSSSHSTHHTCTLAQSCTENLHQFSARGLRNYTFDWQKAGIDTCNRVFNSTVTPDPRALARRYGGYKIGDGVAGVTNMIWSNGQLDPWSGGGFLNPVLGSTGNHWFSLAKGAHHFDLRTHPHLLDHTTPRPLRSRARNTRRHCLGVGITNGISPTPRRRPPRRPRRGEQHNQTGCLCIFI